MGAVACWQSHLNINILLFDQAKRLRVVHWAMHVLSASRFPKLDEHLHHEYILLKLLVKLDEHADGPSTTNRTGWCIRGTVYLNPEQPAGEHYQGFAFDPSSGSLRSSVCVGLQCLIAPPNGTAAHTTMNMAGGHVAKKDN